MDWALDEVVAASPVPARLSRDLDQLLDQLVDQTPSGSHVVIMSNGGFGGIHQRLLARLRTREAS